MPWNIINIEERLIIAIAFFVTYVFIIIAVYGWSLIKWAFTNQGGLIIFQLPGGLK